MEHKANSPQATRAINQVTPLLNHAADEANALAQRGLQVAQSTAQQLREKTADVGDATVRYIQVQPFKSVLIAAATGAALMALVSWVGRSR